MNITTARLTLSPLIPEHAADLLALWSDPDVTRFTKMLPITGVAQCVARIHTVAGDEARQGSPSAFAILREGAAIGVCGAPPTGQPGEAGFYYQLCKREWGNGYASEAARGLLTYLAREKRWEHLVADAVAENTASVAILRGLGFIETRRELGAFPCDLGKLDVLHFRYEFE